MNAPQKPDPVAAADARLEEALRNPACRKRLKQATRKSRFRDSEIKKLRESVK